MSGQKKNKIDEIDKNISNYKDQVSLAEGKFMSSYSSARTKPDSLGTPLISTPPPKQEMRSAGNYQTEK